MKTKTLHEGWKEVELGNIFKYKSKTGRKAGEGLKQGSNKFFTSSSKQTKFINGSDFKGEHLIFPTGGQAAIHYCNENFSTSNDCLVASVNSVLTKYVYYYLRSRIRLLEEGFRGAGLKHISKGYINKIKITFPENKETQKKIVQILEQAEQLKQKREKAYELMNDYLKSVFNEMFSKKDFEGLNLTKITKNLDSERKPVKQSDRAKVSGDIPYYGACGIVDYVNDFTFNEELLLVGEDGQNLISRNKDMAFIVRGKSWVNNHAHVLRMKKDVNIYFLCFYLNSIDYINLISGSAQPKLNQSKLNSLEIPLPPIELQKQFASIAEKVEKIKESQKNSKQEIGKLFNALMQQFFRGEIKC